MPRQNRVTPFGEIVAAPERGTLMGNRGILHDADGRIRRRWATRAWIACVLEFRGRRGPVMAPGHYTRLFFLDEPTALAAGHRPCSECRRAEYLAFREAWARGNANLGLGPAPRAPEIDRVLHAERVGPGGARRTYVAPLGDQPDGALVTFDEPKMTGSPPHPRSGRGGREEGAAAFLVRQGRLWRWTPAGYADRPTPLPTEPVAVLTPRSIVAALASGYSPRVPFHA
jgi:hypothetical protein